VESDHAVGCHSMEGARSAAVEVHMGK
jgi:hypothetical protein